MSDERVYTDDQGYTSTMQRCAAFLKALGPGSGGGFYVAMSGYYIHQFKSRSFFILMLVCYVAPAPVVSLLQQKFDALFDERFSTEVTYPFRVIAMQIILAGLVGVWMWLDVLRGYVLMIGVLMGLVCFAIISSSIQMVAATDPTHIINAKLGLQVGGVLPLIVFSIANFKPTSSEQEFREVVASVIGITVLAAIILAWLHISTIFTKAYQTLQRQETPPKDETTPLIAEEIPERQRMADGDLPCWVKCVDRDAAMDGAPSWVKYWQCVNGLLMGAAFCLVALAGYFGDADLAQALSLLKLSMEFLGRIVSMGIPYVPSFQDGPWHKVMILSSALFLVFTCVCFAQLYNADIPDLIFKISWCSLFVISTVVASLVDVTTGSYVKLNDRKAVALRTQMVLVTSIFIGLIASAGLSIWLEHRLSLKS